ncbi:MAG: hypothetical protein N2999_02695 [Proteobacteria bacterium]|nr:hypothetical protein [Pseudomonadota bacterium]
MKKENNEEEFYLCHKTGKKVSKNNPVCLSPNIYCKHRQMCVIYELYKRNKKLK